MNLRRQLLSLLFLLPVVALAVPYAPEAASSKEILPGRDYITLGTPLPTTTGNKIEVREFFFYGCSHCFALEPFVETWLRSKPADVELVRTPTMLNPSWAPLGRAYYVAEDLQVLAKTHAALYNAIHVSGEKMTAQGDIAKLFQKVAGVPVEKFNTTWDSFTVTTKMRNADALARKYQVSGTPTITVGGKYLVPAAGGRTFEIVDFLVNKERTALGRKK